MYISSLCIMVHMTAHEMDGYSLNDTCCFDLSLYVLDLLVSAHAYFIIGLWRPIGL
jgi:hypothetical protein